MLFFVALGILSKFLVSAIDSLLCPHLWHTNKSFPPSTIFQLHPQLSHLIFSPTTSSLTLKYCSTNPSRLELSISATILSFRSVNILRISSLESASGKKSEIVSKLPDKIELRKSVALTPDPGSAARASP